MELKLLDNLSLKVMGIGSVSVHPDSRGCGYMKILMNMALEDMKKEGVHLSCLGGNRQRYEYFGYTPCGQKISYEINSENVKHSLKKYINKNIVFKEVKDNDFDFIDKAYDLYNKDKFKFSRDKSAFFDILKSWNFDVYSIYNDEIFVGYIVSSKDKGYISELKVKKHEDFIKVLANFIESNNLNKVNIELPVWEKKKVKELNVVASKISQENCYQFNVLNYEEVIKQLLSFKASYGKLVDGSMSFNVLEYGKFKITIENNQVTLDRFDGDCDIELSHLETMQLLFSPFGSYLIDNEKLHGIINSWFPIPLFIPTQDKV